MDTLLDADRRRLSADEFMQTDQHTFGDAWRYELVDGRPVAMAPPTDRHGDILSNLDRVVSAALAASGVPCRMSIGAGARPANAPETRVRIPDAMVRCRSGEQRRPVVLFEILSPSNQGTEYDDRLGDLKQVEGVEEIIEIAQDAIAVRIHRRNSDEWRIVDVHGENAELELRSVGVSVRMADLYADL